MPYPVLKQMQYIYNRAELIFTFYQNSDSALVRVRNKDNFSKSVSYALGIHSACMYALHVHDNYSLPSFKWSRVCVSCSFLHSKSLFRTNLAYYILKFGQNAPAYYSKRLPDFQCEEAGKSP